MRAYLKILLLNLCLVMQSSFARDCYVGSQGYVKITPSGLEKIATSSLNQTKDTIENAVEGLEPFSFSIKSNRDLCNIESWKALEIEESWKKCPGIPNVLTGKSFSISNYKDSAKPIPTDFDFNDFKIRNFDLGDVSVDCNEKRECQVDIEVKKFKMTGDLKSTDIHSNNSLLDIEGLTLTVEGNEEVTPKISFKVNIAKDGSLENLVSFPEKFLNSTFSIENMKVGVGGRESNSDFYDEQFNKFPKGYLEKQVEDFVELASRIYGPDGEYKHLSESRRKELANEYIEKKIEFIKNQLLLPAIEKAQEESLKFTKGDLSQLSYLVASELTDQKPEFMNHVIGLVMPKVGEKLEGIIKSQVEPITGDLPFIHRPYKAQIPNIRMQDYINSEKIKNLRASIVNNVENCLEKGHSCHSDKLSTFMEFLEKSSDSKDIEQLNAIKDYLVEARQRVILAEQERRGNRGRSEQDRRRVNSSNRFISLLGKIDEFLGATDSIEEKLRANVRERNAQLLLELSVGAIDRSEEALGFFLKACSAGCTELKIPSNFHKVIEETEKDYDIAATVRIDTMNEYLKVLQESGMLDVCMVQGQLSHCDELNFLSVEQKFTFTKAPKVVWDKESGHFKLIVEGIQREQDIIGLPSWLTGNREKTSIEVPFDFTIADNGQKIALKPLGKVKSSYDIDEKSYILPTILTFAVAPYAGVAFEIIHRSAHAMVLETSEGEIHDKMQNGVSLQEDLPLKSIVDFKHNGHEMTVFGNL